MQRDSYQARVLPLQYGEKLQVFTGLSLRTHLVLGIGVIRSWRLARLVSKSGISFGSKKLGRRDFLRQAGYLLTGLALFGSSSPKNIHGNFPSPTKDMPCTEGEEYAGCLLLPQHASIPACVKDDRFGIPNMCGVSDSSENKPESAEVIYTTVPTAEALSARKVFPTFTLDPVPLEVTASGASLISHSIGQVWGGWISFEGFNKELGLTYTAIGILAQVDFMRPMPLWAQSSVEEDGPAVVLEKVDDVPGGMRVLIRTSTGFSLHWILQDVYYMMSVNYLPNADPKDIASRLKLVE